MKDTTFRHCEAPRSNLTTKGFIIYILAMKQDCFVPRSDVYIQIPNS